MQTQDEFSKEHQLQKKVTALVNLLAFLAFIYSFNILYIYIGPFLCCQQASVKLAGQERASFCP